MKAALYLWDVDPNNKDAFYAMGVYETSAQGDTRKIPFQPVVYDVERIPSISDEDSALARILRVLQSPATSLVRDFLVLPGEPMKILARLPGLRELLDRWPEMGRIPTSLEWDCHTFVKPLVYHFGAQGERDLACGSTLTADVRGRPLGEIEQAIMRCVKERRPLPVKQGYDADFKHIPLEEFDEELTHSALYGSSDATALMLYGDLGTTHAHEALQLARRRRFEAGLEYRFDFSLAGGRMILWSLGDYSQWSDIVDEVHACVCETNHRFGRHSYPPCPSLTASVGGRLSGYAEIERLRARRVSHAA